MKTQPKKKKIRWIILFIFILSMTSPFLFGYFLPPLLGQYYDLKSFNTQYPYLSVQDDKKKIWKIEFKNTPPPQWVYLAKLPKYVYGAFLVSEDWAFFQHSGYDINQIKDVLNESLQKKRLTRGASTITQQVVKNIYLSHEKTLVRKILELFLAIELEKASNKKRILEVYLNIAELGPRIFGMEKASQHYFSKSARYLQPKEAAFLALLLPSPIKNGQSFKNKELTSFAKKGLRSILLKMQQAGFISEDDRVAAHNTPLSFEKNFEKSLPSHLITGEEDEYYEREESSSEIPQEDPEIENEKKTILKSLKESTQEEDEAVPPSLESIEEDAEQVNP